MHYSGNEICNEHNPAYRMLTGHLLTGYKMYQGM